MAKNPIGWCEETWNPVTGCSPVSEACENCYAKRMATRLRGRYGYPADEPFRVTLHPERLDQPLHWQKPRRIFVCSMGDLFHKNVPFGFIEKCFAVMALAPQHTHLILTKRDKRMLAFLEDRDRCFNRITEAVRTITGDMWRAVLPTHRHGMVPGRWPLPNVHLGVTVENQKRADERIPILLKTPAAVRFVSYEPGLGPLDLSPYWSELLAFNGITGECDEAPGLDWVIAGGENGPGARPMNPAWARSLRDQCVAAGVPFWFKGMGGGDKIKKLDGKTWNQFPEVLDG